MAAMVQLRNISKRFGAFTALQEVSFEIAEGEFMTFLGPSGCGKTTCLRLISGFDTPSTGEVLIGGKDVTFDPPYRRSVNQVFQSYALFPHLSIYENISFGLRMKKLPAADIKKRVDRVVEMTSLQEFVIRKPAQLSGGQRRPTPLLLAGNFSSPSARKRFAFAGRLRADRTPFPAAFLPKCSREPLMT
jgi:spermidine/putrescine transport system ATP-binding protein